MGVELTSVGLPVIVAGEAWIRNKGLTSTPARPRSTSGFSTGCRSPTGSTPAQLARARRYAYHFFFNRMIPLPFIEPKAGYPIYRLKLERLQHLLPGESAGLDTICERHSRETPVRARETAPATRPSELVSALIRHSAVIALISLFVATVTAIAVGARACVVVAPAIGAVVPPRPDRWHSAPTPTMGGIAIARGNRHRLRRRSLARPMRRADLVDVAAGARWPRLAMFVVGLFDDRLQLSPLAKLVASLAIGAFLVFALAGAEPDGALPLALHAHRQRSGSPASATPSTCSTTWTAWRPASRSSRPLFLACAARHRRSVPALVVLLVALAGALVGFPLLEPPARAAVHGRLRQPVHRRDARRRRRSCPSSTRAIAFVSPSVLVVLILVVPLFDTAFVLVLRRLAGRRATQGRHRSRLASPGVARFLGAQRGSHPVSAWPRRRRCRPGCL